MTGEHEKDWLIESVHTLLWVFALLCVCVYLWGESTSFEVPSSLRNCLFTIRHWWLSRPSTCGHTCHQRERKRERERKKGREREKKKERTIDSREGNFKKWWYEGKGQIGSERDRSEAETEGSMSSFHYRADNTFSTSDTVAGLWKWAVTPYRNNLVLLEDTRLHTPVTLSTFIISHSHAVS